MKTALHRLSTRLLSLGLLIFGVSGCDSTGSNEIPNEEAVTVRATVSKLVTPGTKELVYLNNINDTASLTDVRGYAELDQAEMVFDEYGIGPDETTAKSRLSGISLLQQESALTHTFSFDAASPKGARVNLTARVPRFSPLRIQKMAGKIGIYDVDAPLDIRTWKGWVTVRSASPSVKVNFDEGDLVYLQTSCGTNNLTTLNLDAGAALLVPARTTVSGSTQTGRMNLSVEEGTIKIEGLTIVSGQIVNKGNGQVFQGVIERTGGDLNMTMKKGTIVVRSWDAYFANGGK